MLRHETLRGPGTFRQWRKFKCGKSALGNMGPVF